MEFQIKRISLYVSLNKNLASIHSVISIYFYPCLHWFTSKIRAGKFSLSYQPVRTNVIMVHHFNEEMLLTNIVDVDSKSFTPYSFFPSIRTDFCFLNIIRVRCRCGPDIHVRVLLRKSLCLIQVPNSYKYVFKYIVIQFIEHMSLVMKHKETWPVSPPLWELSPWDRIDCPQL